MGDNPHESIHQNSSTIRDLWFKTMGHYPKRGTPDYVRNVFKASDVLHLLHWVRTTEFTSDSGNGNNLTSKLKAEANPVNLEVRICRRAEEPLTQIEVR